MTTLAADVTSEAVEACPAEHVLLVCPACLRMLQTRPLLVGKTGHCVYCRTPLRAESDGMGGVRAVSIGNDAVHTPVASEPVEDILVHHPSEDPNDVRVLPRAVVRPNFASSAKIPSRWGFPARSSEEERMNEITPRGFAEALFGEAHALAQVECLGAPPDQASSPATAGIEHVREILPLAPLPAYGVGLVSPKPPVDPSEHGRGFKVVGAVLALASLSYAAYHYSPTPEWEEWRNSAAAWFAGRIH